MTDFNPIGDSFFVTGCSYGATSSSYSYNQIRPVSGPSVSSDGWERPPGGWYMGSYVSPDGTFHDPRDYFCVCWYCGCGLSENEARRPSGLEEYCCPICAETMVRKCSVCEKEYDNEDVGRGNVCIHCWHER